MEQHKMSDEEAMQISQALLEAYGEDAVKQSIKKSLPIIKAAYYDVDIDKAGNKYTCHVTYADGTTAIYTDEKDLKFIHQQLTTQFEKSGREEYFAKETSHLGLGE